MRTFTISSISTSEPITINDVKEHLRIQTTAEDRILAGYIKVARIELSNKIKRTLIPTSYLMEIDSFKDTIILPLPPLSSTSADVVIKYINSSGGTSTCSSTVYTVDYRSEPAKLYLAHDASWPTDVRDVEGAIKISFKAGYTTATIPENAALWLKYRVGVMYEHREPIIEGRTITVISRNYIDGLVDDLLNYSTEI
jgi:uncharacterized phiE125 gp8 family phage protein